MADAGGLQLLPSQKKHINFRVLTGGNKLVTFSILVVILLGCAYGVIKYYKNKTLTEINTIDVQIEAIYKSRNKTEEEKLNNFQKQLAMTRSLLQSHTTWSVGFRAMEQIIEPRVKFTSLTADASKKLYSFNASADGYTTVAKQIAAFYRSDAISDVRLNNVSASGTGGVDFTLDVTFHPNKFLLIKKQP